MENKKLNIDELKNISGGLSDTEIKECYSMIDNAFDDDPDTKFTTQSSFFLDFYNCSLIYDILKQRG